MCCGPTGNGPDVPTTRHRWKVFLYRERSRDHVLSRREDGAEVYGQQRIKPGTYSGSPVLADGKIYVTNEDGLTTVVGGGAEV
jgi:hypothetical protein